MGRLRQKRPRLEIPADLKLSGNVINELLGAQERGDAHYGDFLHPSTERRSVQYPLRFLYAFLEREPIEPAVRPLDFRLFQPQPKPVEDLPLEPPLANWKPPVFSEDGYMEEESLLIFEAKSLGKSWQDIANMLPGRTHTQVRKHYNLLAQRRRQKEKEMQQKRAERSNANGFSVPSNGLKNTGDKHKLQNGSTANDVDNLVVDPRCTEREGGDARVKLKKLCLRPPKGNTVFKAHKLKSLEGVNFYEEVEVVDPDDPSKTYIFNVNDRIHAACFNIGVGPDGSPLISWSELVSLYQLPDGTKWAEHINLFDAEDLESLAARKGVSTSSLIPKDTTGEELFKMKRRCHSRLQNIEYECWIFKDRLPAELLVPTGDAYYWRFMIDPETMEKTPG